jgi:hypothetical protein
MNAESTPEPVVAFCPYCGGALGSFFGTRTVTGARVCDRCQECFEVHNVKEYEAEELDAS